jgi:hypothetical protein
VVTISQRWDGSGGERTPKYSPTTRGEQGEGAEADHYPRGRLGDGQGDSLEGKSIRPVQPGGKGAAASVGREFIDVSAGRICLKQVTRAVKGQTFRRGQPGGKGAAAAVRGEFVDAVLISYKQITRAVKG